jgi:hypothetical protein
MVSLACLIAICVVCVLHGAVARRALLQVPALVLQT